MNTSRLTAIIQYWDLGAWNRFWEFRLWIIMVLHSAIVLSARLESSIVCSLNNAQYYFELVSSHSCTDIPIISMCHFGRKCCATWVRFNITDPYIYML